MSILRFKKVHHLPNFNMFVISFAGHKFECKSNPSDLVILDFFHKKTLITYKALMVDILNLGMRILGRICKFESLKNVNC